MTPAILRRDQAAKVPNRATAQRSQALGLGAYQSPQTLDATDEGSLWLAPREVVIRQTMKLRNI